MSRYGGYRDRGYGGDRDSGGGSRCLAVAGVEEVGGEVDGEEVMAEEEKDSEETVGEMVEAV